MKSLNIAATGMLAQQTNVDVIANNIANMNTIGYKRFRPEFQDLLYQNLRRVGAESSDAGTIVPNGVQIGVGVKTASVYRITQQGNLISTGNTLDIAIQGTGYFQVLQPSGTNAFTRAGSFQLSAQGQIVTVDGFTVSPGITIPTDAVDVTINANGTVQAKIDGQVTPQTVGTLDLVSFANGAGLESIGGNLLLETPSSGAPTVSSPGSPGFGFLQQGFIETSNVDAVTEITALIAAQRAYEMNSKVITTADEMMRTASQLR
jgi:flagellar basal-body rod protein FlgG